MNKFLFISCALFCVLIINSCATKIYPIKGDYALSPIVVKTKQPVDSVINHLINFFEREKMNIKTIDRVSGIIISDRSTLSATTENSKLKPYYNDAYIVIPNIHDGSTGLKIAISGQKWDDKKNVPIINPVYGDWNFKIKSDGTESIISIGLTNVNYFIPRQRGKSSVTKELLEYRSTGNFEKKVSDILN